MIMRRKAGGEYGLNLLNKGYSMNNNEIRRKKKRRDGMRSEKRRKEIKWVKFKIRTRKKERRIVRCAKRTILYMGLRVLCTSLAIFIVLKSHF